MLNTIFQVLSRTDKLTMDNIKYVIIYNPYRRYPTIDAGPASQVIIVLYITLYYNNFRLIFNNYFYIIIINIYLYS